MSTQERSVEGEENRLHGIEPYGNLNMDAETKTERAWCSLWRELVF